MDQIALGATGRTTTRLGFGCSSLMGSISRRESLRLLEAAYDAGIRHFDVAPMYGYGEAEGCLGEFLQHHRSDVTVTTKYGIPPGKKSSVLSVARRVVAPIVKSLPGLKQRLASVASAATGSGAKAAFSPSEARTSLQNSLAQLRTDHIDIWLLHEATASDLSDDGLLQLLQGEVAKGTIGAFGVGSDASKIPALLAQRPAYCPTLQYEWSVLDSPIPPAEKPFRLHHRALTDNFIRLHQSLTHDKELCRRWSSSTNTDLAIRDELAHLMLKASLVMNPASVILFSSKKIPHIHANVKAAEDSRLDSPARELYRLLQTERDQLSDKVEAI
jgi:D-threo-aldose 1-dehydrogenase